MCFVPVWSLVCLSVSVYVCPPVCLCLCMSVFCLSACLSGCLPVCLSVCLPVCLSVCLLFARVFVGLTVLSLAGRLPACNSLHLIMNTGYLRGRSSPQAVGKGCVSQPENGPSRPTDRVTEVSRGANTGAHPAGVKDSIPPLWFTPLVGNARNMSPPAEKLWARGLRLKMRLAAEGGVRRFVQKYVVLRYVLNLFSRFEIVASCFLITFVS